MNKQDIKVINVLISQLNPAPYNPRKWSQTAEQHLRESIERFGLVDPIIVNGAENRKNIVIGGHFRLKIAKDIGYTEIPAVFLNIPDIEKEKELNLRLNRDTGEWDLELLKQFDVDLLLDVPRKSKWRSKGFALREVFRCGNCGAMITPEEKFKLLINGSFKRHVYYHCTRYIDHNCKEPYISEEKLIDKLIEFVQSLEENKFKIGEKLRASFNQYQKVARTVLKQQGVDDDDQIVTLKDYEAYILKEGLSKDKEELIRSLNIQLYLHNRELSQNRN